MYVRKGRMRRGRMGGWGRVGGRGRVISEPTFPNTQLYRGCSNGGNCPSGGTCRLSELSPRIALSDSDSPAFGSGASASDSTTVSEEGGLAGAAEEQSVPRSQAEAVPRSPPPSARHSGSRAATCQTPRRAARRKRIQTATWNRGPRYVPRGRGARGEGPRGPEGPRGRGARRSLRSRPEPSAAANLDTGKHVVPARDHHVRYPLGGVDT